MRKITKKLSFSITLEDIEVYLQAIGLVAALTAIMFLIGRETLGEGVIALLFLIPISWSSAKWGQGPGFAAAIAASLAFNFFFIPPYYTFYIGSLEGWLILGIFTLVAVIIVARIQSVVVIAQAREREATFMYELSATLAGVNSNESVARTLASQIQRLYQAAQVEIFIEENGESITINEPAESNVEGKPDMVLPLMSAYGLEGEIRLWRGETRLPRAEDRLLLNFSKQGALAIHRARLFEARERVV
jgi:two-component system sensor histidine kinase KdpD